MRRDDAGERWDVYAQLVGRDWKFFARQRRYELWQAIETPSIEDWLELLDALRRLSGRRRYTPDDVKRVENTIHERFPGAEF